VNGTLDLKLVKTILSKNPDKYNHEESKDGEGQDLSELVDF
jgi:hypothetical protein